MDKIRDLAVKISTDDESEKRTLLERCASTALSSKLVAHQKNFFAKMVVDAVMCLDHLLPLNMIGMKKIQGGALEVSVALDGTMNEQHVSLYYTQGRTLPPMSYKVLGVTHRLKRSN